MRLRARRKSFWGCRFAALRRRAIIAEGRENELKFKTPLFPYVTLFGIWAQVICLVVMVFTPDLRDAIFAGLPMLLVPMGLYRLRLWRRHRQELAKAVH